MCLESNLVRLWTMIRLPKHREHRSLAKEP